MSVTAKRHSAWTCRFCGADMLETPDSEAQVHEFPREHGCIWAATTGRVLAGCEFAFSLLEEVDGAHRT